VGGWGARRPPERTILTALHVCLFAVLCAVPGLPLAALLARGRARSLASLVAQGVLLGLVVVLTVALAVAHPVGLGAASVGAPVAALSLVAWVALLATGGLRTIPAPRATWPGAAMAVVLLVALGLRLHPVYFLAQTGDFGEYVNRGLIVADGGPFIEWFLQLFSIALAVSALVVGEAAMVDLVPFLGMLLVVGLVSLAHELGFSPVVRTALAAALALQVVPVWFSLLPTSEILYAVLLVTLLLFLLLGLQRGHHAEAAVAGVVVGLQTVTRGNALLLLPVLAAGVAVAMLLVPRPAARRMMTFLGVAAVATSAGFAYNVWHSAPYFVDHNLRSYLPGDVVDAIVGVETPASLALGLAVVLAATAAVLAGAEGLNRRLGPPRAGRAVRVLRAGLLPLALLGTTVAVVVLGPSGIAAGLGTYGLTLGLVAGAGVVVALRELGDAPVPTRALLAPVVLVGAAFAVLFAYRIPEMRESFTYLYWDRYLFSEVFPLLAILALWGLALVEAAARAASRRLEGRRVAGAGVAATAALVVLAGAAELVSSTSLLRQETYFAGFYEHLAELDELTTDEDGEREPLVYVGMQTDLPEGWFHLNTHRVFALPMIETFDRQMVNGRQPAFQWRDHPVDTARIAELLQENDLDRALAVEVVPAGGADAAVVRPVAGPDHVLVERRVGVVHVELPVLADHPRSDRSWHRNRVDLVVTEVALPD
jgi:hypothetical protein